MVYCGVEQWLARETHNLKVVGSNPSPATLSLENDNSLSNNCTINLRLAI